jgi:hypothetical protein
VVRCVRAGMYWQTCTLPQARGKAVTAGACRHVPMPGWVRFGSRKLRQHACMPYMLAGRYVRMLLCHLVGSTRWAVSQAARHLDGVLRVSSWCKGRIADAQGR